MEISEGIRREFPDDMRDEMKSLISQCQTERHPATKAGPSILNRGSRSGTFSISLSFFESHAEYRERNPFSNFLGFFEILESVRRHSRFRYIGCPTSGVAQRAMRETAPHTRGVNKARQL
jgi:hypothetical protein